MSCEAFIERKMLQSLAKYNSNKNCLGNGYQNDLKTFPDHEASKSTSSITADIGEGAPAHPFTGFITKSKKSTVGPKSDSTRPNRKKSNQFKMHQMRVHQGHQWVMLAHLLLHSRRLTSVFCDYICV